MPGHDPGHPSSTPPIGLDWAHYVEHFVTQLGGWTALADELIRRTQAEVDAPTDLQSVEKGLRRLARREHLAGGQYGRWMLRHFGVPSTIEDWARWLAQYHSRFADLPTSLRLEQLRLWDRAPLSESRSAVWIHIGLASVHHRLADLPNCRSRLQLASHAAKRATAAANAELQLLEARLATDDGRRDDARRLLASVEPLLDSASLGADDRHCYHARWIGQRAYLLTKPGPGEVEDLRGALQLFEDIEDDKGPFVGFRKQAGLAYCTWKLGDTESGVRLARAAAEHAGDGGFVRFRIMALNLLSRMLPADEAREVNARAARLAKQLEDEDLMRRVAHRRVDERK